MQAHGDNNADFENRRGSRRIRTLKKGTIVLAGGVSVFDCTVRNISETGALLHVPSLAIPSHFELRMDSTMPRHECTVRWRAESAIGVSFDDIQQAA